MKMNCGPTREERALARHRELKEWHRYFAWRPIRVGRRECRWLETIERKGTFHTLRFAPHCSFWEWEYRPRGGAA
jgi:hypothetical protein